MAYVHGFVAAVPNDKRGPLSTTPRQPAASSTTMAHGLAPFEARRQFPSSWGAMPSLPKRCLEGSWDWRPHLGMRRLEASAATDKARLSNAELLTFTSK